MAKSDELIYNSPAHSKALFDLGWDYFSALQGLPKESEKFPALIDGYNAAKERIHPVRNDRFYMKWLQLRFGALKRNRLFDPEVTPKIIELMDVTHCPITLVKLTHSTMLDSDWSIDRVSNERGYVLGNLLIVSKKANSAKGNMSIDEIQACASVSVPMHGLTPIEWQRWLAICSLNGFKANGDSYSTGYYCVPFVVELPSLMVINPSAYLQVAIARKVCGVDDVYKKLIEGLSKPARKAFNGVLSDAMQYKNMVINHHCEIWYIPKLFSRFQKSFNAISEIDHVALSNKINIISITNCNGVSFKVDMKEEAWNPLHKGYVQ